MDEIRELHRVLNEEHGDIVADEVPIAFVRVELYRKTAHIARRICRPALAQNRRKAHENRRSLARFGKERGTRDSCHRRIALEIAMRSGTASMNDALRDALVIEMGDLLA